MIRKGLMKMDLKKFKEVLQEAKKAIAKTKTPVTTSLEEFNNIMGLSLMDAHSFASMLKSYLPTKSILEQESMYVGCSENSKLVFAIKPENPYTPEDLKWLN